MIKTVISKPGEKITEEEQIKFSKEVQKAKAMPETFDEECSELSPAMIKALKCVASRRNRRKA